MKNVVLVLFLGMFCNNVLAQRDDVRLGLCDDLPLQFYQQDYRSIVIENGMGYCRSPEKILDQRITAFKNLESLTFLHSPLSAEYQDYTLPEEISELHNLSTLNTNIPNNAVFGLSSLTNLTLNIHGETTMELLDEEGFYELHQLEFLKLQLYNGLANNYSIKGISGLKKLKEVRLYNPSQQLIDEVLANPYIETLNINSTIDVTFDFSKMLSLKELLLNGNGLDNIPPSIIELPLIEKLEITNNDLTTIPSNIGEMKKLQVLVLGRNKLSSIPSEITQCTSCEVALLLRLLLEVKILNMIKLLTIRLL
ncbi:MAG: hypothetical protein GQ574_00190 [Crocinitomix sp.]|nr:hypothetical protein [Crocinitomix sp.]